MANAVKCAGTAWTLDNLFQGLAAETAVAALRGLRVISVTPGTTKPVACGDNPEDILRLFSEAIALDPNGYLAIRVALTTDATNGQPILCTDNETPIQTLSRSFIYDSNGNVALHLIVTTEA